MKISVVLGLGFGDEGKGTIVDWLARSGPPPLVVRWNGGPQAAHHVVTDDGRVHCFAQLGSAAFVDGARTHLAGDMAVDLPALATELDVFARVAGARPEVTIDPRCVLVTPWHAIVGRVREAMRGAHRHGSTGRGVAEAKLTTDPRERMLAGELASDQLATRTRELRAQLLARAAAVIDSAERDRELAPAARAEARALVERGGEADLLALVLAAARAPHAITAAPPPAAHVILEGAQGALLDRDHGFFPHVTPSRITRAAAERTAHALGLAGELAVWGVLRAYHTRHGEGPFPSEDLELAARLPELHNDDRGPAGRFRVGWFDAVLARHALRFAGPIDHLAVTCLDRIAALPRRAIVDAWHDERLDTAGAFAARPHLREVDDVAGAISEALARPIDVESWGPAASGKLRTSARGARC